MITLREITNKSDWIPETIYLDVPLTQTFFYGEIQKNTGRDVRRFKIIENDISIGFVQFIAYPLIGSKKYWYAPYGPVLNNISEDILEGLKKEIKAVSKKENAAFVRLDFTPKLESVGEKLVSKYFKIPPRSSYVGAYFQPRNEWYTNIENSPEIILAGMHQKTRYSVRLAEKKEVTTNIISLNLSSALEGFLALMRITSTRNGFSLHNNEYYENYFREIEKEGNGFIIEAWYESELLASHFVVIVGNTAYYVFGSSSNNKRDLCAPYLAHFNGMLEAKKRGASFYNFGAISEGDNDHWKNLTVFKQKFGGTTFPHSPFFDLVLNPLWYYIYIIRKLIKSYI